MLLWTLVNPYLTRIMLISVRLGLPRSYICYTFISLLIIMMFRSPFFYSLASSPLTFSLPPDVWCPSSNWWNWLWGNQQPVRSLLWTVKLGSDRKRWARRAVGNQVGKSWTFPMLMMELINWIWAPAVAMAGRSSTTEHVALFNNSSLRVFTSLKKVVLFFEVNKNYWPMPSCQHQECMGKSDSETEI